MTSSKKTRQTKEPKNQENPHDTPPPQIFPENSLSSTLRNLPSVLELFSGENWFKAPVCSMSSSSADTGLNSFRTTPTNLMEQESYSFSYPPKRSSFVKYEDTSKFVEPSDDLDQACTNYSSPEGSQESSTYHNTYDQVGPSQEASTFLGQPNYVAKRHICHICHKRFPRPSSLRVHLHTHTGEKPYVCEHPNCNRSFSVLSNLRRHSKTHNS